VRVNGVFKDKHGRLVVDCLGPAHELKAALASHSSLPEAAALLEFLLIKGDFASPAE
jgi:hypothetical protein